jgi:hypothetical protein
MRRWNEAEYDVLFRDHPPINQRAPDLATCRAVARTIRRTPEAVTAYDWPAATFVSFGKSSRTSQP